MTGPPRLFALICLCVLLAFAAAKYQGVALFGSPTQAAQGGGSNYSSGTSGSHK